MTPSCWRTVIGFGSPVRASRIAARRHALTLSAAVAVVLATSVSSTAAAEHGFLDRTFDEHRYVVFIPQGKPPATGWPLILFLHGAGERGTDGEKQVEFGIGPSIRKRAETFPAVVVFPQADFADGPILETWRAGEPGGVLARDILAEVEQRWPVDPLRRAITGWSMGAYGALSLAADDPGHWSRVLAISGGGEPEWTEPLSTRPVWLVHGARDKIVPASESRILSADFASEADRMTYTELSTADHNVWRTVYDNDEVLNWLLDADAALPPVQAIIDADLAVDDAPLAADVEPFHPQLIISKAISLRLGNDALDTLSAGVPSAVRERGLSGELPPIEDQAEFDSRTFDIRFTNMEFYGQLAQAILRGHGADRLRVDFALRDFEVRIGQIDVGDATDSVTTGPVSVFIGHREPVWMKLEVRPVATPEGSLRLSLLRSEFAIPDNNWYVKPPKQIDIRGELFNESIVRTAVVGGIYQRKTVLEQQMLDAVEPILAQVEARADFSPLAGLVTSLWPLPVYQPRLKVLLEETSTDRDGVSLVFGCAVAGLEQSPDRASAVDHVAAASPPAYRIRRSTDLHAAVAVDVIEHLSAMVAGSEAAQLYAADVPGRPFHELDDASAVAAVAATNGTVGSIDDVRARFMLTDPFRLVPIDGEPRDGSAVHVAVEIPRLTMTLFGTDRQLAVTSDRDNARKWTVIAEHDLILQQPIRLATITDINQPTQLFVDWEESGTASLRETSDADKASQQFAEMFQQGLSRWARTQQGSRTTLSDLAIGSSTLRLEQFSWQGECLTAEFLPAATILANRTERRVTYRIRSEHSRWSDELVIRPDHVHIYRTGSRLQIRDARRWSRNGQPLAFGTYDWSPRPDDAGYHWVQREPAASPVVGVSRPTPQAVQ